MEDMEFLKAMLAEMNTKLDTTEERMDATIKQMMERLIGSLVSIMEANRKTDRDEMKQEIRAGQQHMQEMIRTNQAKKEATIHSMQSELDETIRHRIENVITCLTTRYSLQKELTEKIDKTQVELKGTKTTLDHSPTATL
jgi:hypothetical protein